MSVLFFQEIKFQENLGTFQFSKQTRKSGGSEFYHRDRHQFYQNLCSENPGARLKIKHIKFSSRHSVRKIQEQQCKKHIKFSRSDLSSHTSNRCIFPGTQIFTIEQMFFPGARISAFNRCLFPGARISASNRCLFPGVESENNRSFFPAVERPLNSYFVFSSRRLLLLYFLGKT